MIFMKQKEIEDGMYALLPSFCMDKECDCRRAFIFIRKVEEESEGPILATISYGWEAFSFYRNWASHLGDDALREFMGPALDSHQPQTAYADFLLDTFKNVVLKDTEYIERLKRQYLYFKKKRGMSVPIDMRKLINGMDSCPCGSGNPLRRCCLKERSLSKRRKKR